MASEEIACVIHGYHVYKKTLGPQEDEFTVKHEPNNEHDRYAMAVLVVSNGSERVVGHLPREYAATSLSMEIYGKEGKRELQEKVEDWKSPALSVYSIQDMQLSRR